MIKTILFVVACIFCSNLRAQQRMILNINPSSDARASVELQIREHQVVQLVFNQSGTRAPEKSAFSWVQDSTRIVNVRRLGRYFQQFTFSDTINLKAEQALNLLKAFTEVYANRDNLSKLEDDRLMLDGMPSSLIIPVGPANQYTIAYRPPVLKQAQSVDRLVREIITALKMKSGSPATVNYCMVIDHYLK
ncbi:hypothetical protein [Fibrella forsythiae]|uniref:Uncharacterized protein n=1 Tax=Fibrella forsythiae TaxID=2817061 RepID=A0ABS3JR57_9BACT|nr:hypothetical protein [Fibrella forsythiae]MBO0951856.1 hypothetical protein [Fibrella forsythiae]